MTKGFLLTGPVAAGKTATADILQEEYEDTEIYEMGDYAREMFNSGDLPDTHTVNEGETVSTWAGRLRDEQGETWLAEILTEDLADADIDHAVVSGVRSPEEIEHYRNNLDEVVALYIDANAFTRYERRMDGRSGDEQVEPGEFFERDYREWQWGIDEIYNEELYDHLIDNNEDLVHLESQLVGL